MGLTTFFISELSFNIAVTVIHAGVFFVCFFVVFFLEYLLFSVKYQEIFPLFDLAHLCFKL